MPFVTLEREGNVALITMNRPEALGDNPLGQSSECTPMGILRKA